MSAGALCEQVDVCDILCLCVCVFATRPLTFPCPDSVPGERGMGREAEEGECESREAFVFLLEALMSPQPEP